MLTNNNELFHEIKVQKPILKTTTDHFFINVSTNLQHSSPNIISNDAYKSPLDKLNFQSDCVNWELLIQEFDAVKWENILQCLSLDEMLDKILDINYDISLKCVPES